MRTDLVMGWLGIGPLLWATFRVALVWAAFDGTGAVISGSRYRRRNFRLMPRVVIGMVAYILLALLLSLLHALTRPVLSVTVAAGAAIWALRAYRAARRSPPSFRPIRLSPLMLPAWLLAAFLAISALTVAGRPEMNFNDTQVTYLVQPDRWLNHGHIHFLEETKFSGFPMIAEILLLYPSSLATDRLDQLILGQVFSVSILLLLVPVSMKVTGLGARWIPAGAISILGCTILLIWSHFAKPDPTLLFFTTLSLSAMLRKITDEEHANDLSPYLLMGLALSTKYTAYLVLLPLTVMHLSAFGRGKGWKFHAKAAAMVFLLPAAFAARTMLHTGAPFYPHTPPGLPVSSFWKDPPVQINYRIFDDKSSHFYPRVTMLRNVFDYFRAWGPPLFLLLAGLLATAGGKVKRRGTVLLGFLSYSAAAVMLFRPAWWGAKYGILMVPFAALYGMRLLSEHRRGLAAATAVAVVSYLCFDTAVFNLERYDFFGRMRIVESYAKGRWAARGLEAVESQHELPMIMWMNGHLPENSRILSLFPTKRYFSNHTWLVAWRYPPAMRLFLDDSIDDELEILEELNVDYVLARYDAPAPMDDGRLIATLAGIGRGDILEPVLQLNGFLLLKFNPLAR